MYPQFLVGMWARSLTPIKLNYLLSGRSGWSNKADKNCRALTSFWDIAVYGDGSSAFGRESDRKDCNKIIYFNDR